MPWEWQCYHLVSVKHVFGSLKCKTTTGILFFERGINGREGGLNGRNQGNLQVLLKLSQI